MRYYLNTHSEFSCIGGRCQNTCCNRWKIWIDDESKDFYFSQKDEVGETLRQFIEVNEQGDAFFPNDSESCKMLTKDGLCQIYQHYGEEHMCQTCRTFPRVRMSVEEGADRYLDYVTNECEEALRLLRDLPQFVICVDGEVVNEDIVDSVVKIGAWILDSIQDETVPPGEALSVSLFVMKEICKPAFERDKAGIQSVMMRVADISMRIRGFVQDFSQEELDMASWGLTSKIVVAFLDIFLASNLSDLADVVPDPKKYERDSGERGNQLKTAYLRFEELMSEKKELKLFWRRYAGNIIMASLFSVFQDDGEDVLLYELAPKILISLLVPALWPDECWDDEDDYLPRLSMLQRVVKDRLIKKYLSPVIKEQMQIDAMVYSVMMIGVLDW